MSSLMHASFGGLHDVDLLDGVAPKGDVVAGMVPGRVLISWSTKPTEFAMTRLERWVSIPFHNTPPDHELLTSFAIVDFPLPAPTHEGNPPAGLRLDVESVDEGGASGL